MTKLAVLWRHMCSALHEDAGRLIVTIVVHA